MSILLTEETKIIVQGITGREGRYHTKAMLDYGTSVLGGVTPGKKGQNVEGLPVFDTCREAVLETGANASVIFVPAPFTKDAIIDAADGGVRLIVCITEGIPFQDMVEAVAHVKKKGACLIGPNCAGIASPGIGKMGITPSAILKKGSVGVVSRSGTLTYEVVEGLSNLGIGQTTCVGIGGDPILGLTFRDLLEMFENDEDTEAVVMIGEIGGSDEENAAEYISQMTKPVVSFISGRTAPPDKQMGHAGAIISGGKGTADSKVKALKDAGVPIMDTTGEVLQKIKSLL
ncbi:succinate--CoA ligase subunit alpha [PVC group bacterium (ex Bugula neritina AB1)]|nr:succinate--CoA ligase subunit alpha [PVC group bacterium (ex Bugula neritina AB1)]